MRYSALKVCEKPASNKHGGKCAEHTAWTGRAYFAWTGWLHRLAALLLLIPALPIIAMLALLARLSSPGPGIYRQNRVGYRNKTFTLYKIRTMRQDAEAASGPVWSSGKGDPRVTQFGSFIRALHLDELPQLFNVVRGEMNLIGPRPERPEFTEHLAEAFPGYVQRVAIRPGITGLAQIQLPADTDLDSVQLKLATDLKYLESATLWLDLRIVACTARLVRAFGFPYGAGGTGRSKLAPGHAPKKVPPVSRAFDRHLNDEAAAAGWGPVLSLRSLTGVSTLLLVLFTRLPSADAGTVTFSYTGNSPNATISDSAATATVVSAGPGVTTGISGDNLDTANWTTATSLDVNDYVGFSITPVAGYSVSITGFSLISDRADTGGSGRGPRAAALRYSTNGFGSFTQSSTSPQPSGKPPQTLTAAVSLSGLTSTSNAAFRIFGWNNNSAAVTWELDDITVTYSADSLASLNGSLAASPTARAMQNTANVRYQVNVTNDALAPSGGGSAAGLNYTLALTGTTGLSLASPSTGSGLARNATANHFVDVDTSATGIHGGGSVSVTGSNAWRADGVAGTNLATYSLGSLAVVDNRDLSQEGGAVDLGNVLVGFNTSTGIATVTGGAADDNHATRVTLGNGNVTQSEVTVGGGSVFTFNGAGQTTTRNVTGNFSSSGAKSGNVNLASQLANAETLLTGTVTLDSAVNVAFVATAYDTAWLTDNTGAVLDSGSQISIANAAGPYRSAAFVDAISLSPGWTVNNLAVGNSIAPGNGTSAATVTHNDAGLLNNQLITGTLDIALENSQSLVGAANQDLGTLHWNLSHTVSGQSGNQTAAVAVNGSYANLSGTSNALLGSVATVLAGSNTNGPTTTVGMSWRDRAAGELPPLNPTNPLVSDVVDLTGTNGDIFVLELTYAPSELSLPEETLAAAGSLYLGWLDGGVWRNAIDGNLGTNTGNPSLLNYQGSWASSGAGLSLGAWGVDTPNNVVWAVLDHNSDFAVTEAASLVVSEPSGLVFVLVGFLCASAICVGQQMK